MFEEADVLRTGIRQEAGDERLPDLGSGSNVAGPFLKGPGVVRAVYPMDRANVVFRDRGTVRDGIYGRRR